MQAGCHFWVVEGGTGDFILNSPGSDGQTSTFGDMYTLVAWTLYSNGLLVPPAADFPLGVTTGFWQALAQGTWKPTRLM